MREQSITMRECLMADINSLEDQRDMAREDAKRATYDAAQETIKVSKVKSAWIEACRERDEARELFRTAIELSKKYKDERDEARNLADAAMWEADRMRGKLWRSCDREEKLACERNRWKLACLAMEGLDK